MRSNYSNFSISRNKGGCVCVGVGGGVRPKIVIFSLFWVLENLKKT